MRFKINWASLIAGDKCAISAMFYYIFEGNFPSTSPWRAYIWRGDLQRVFCVWFGGLIFGGAYTWRGLFSEFYGISTNFEHYSWIYKGEAFCSVWFGKHFNSLIVKIQP